MSRARRGTERSSVWLHCSTALCVLCHILPALPKCSSAIVTHYNTVILPNCHTTILLNCHTAKLPSLPYCECAWLSPHLRFYHTLPECSTAVLDGGWFVNFGFTYFCICCVFVLHLVRMSTDQRHSRVIRVFKCRVRQGMIWAISFGSPVTTNSPPIVHQLTLILHSVSLW